MNTTTKRQILQQYWSFDSFRGNQEQIIDAVLSGYDTLALMATGGGKSLCYQLPGLMLDGVCIVVSPLISLMEDQEQSLKKKGIKAVSIHSGKSKKIQDELFDNCVYGDVKFLFLSPEKLNSNLALTRIGLMKVSFFVIDEAHCISQWGHDFRPSYLLTKVIKDEFPENKILALTATATSDVVKDIIEFASFEKDHRIFRSSFFRENISISVIKTVRKLQRIERIIKVVRGSKIIYARNKRHCQEINNHLRRLGLNSEVYHADVPIKIRIQRQKAWIDGELECMVCTSAFGMGIDKSDVRLVLHYDLPPSLEEYIQEFGRAGRDRKGAYAILLYNNYDLKDLEFHYLNGRPTLAEIKNIYNELGKFLDIPIGGGLGQKFSLDVNAFEKKVKINKTKLRAVLKILEKNEYIRADDNLFSRERIHIIAGKEVLNGFLGQESDIAILSKYLLRSYEGLLYGYVSISSSKVIEKLGWGVERYEKAIQYGTKTNIFRYEAETASKYLTYINERLPKLNLSVDGSSLKKLYRSMQYRYEAVIEYILLTDCRPLYLLNYFGEQRSQKCGTCDFCKGAFESAVKKEEYIEARSLILSKVKEAPCDLETLIDLWPWNKQNKMKKVLERMLEKEELTFSKGHFALIVLLKQR